MSKNTMPWFGEQLFGVKPRAAPAPAPDPMVARRKAEETARESSAERKRRLKKYGRSSTFGTAGRRRGLVTIADQLLSKKKLLGH